MRGNKRLDMMLLIGAAVISFVIIITGRFVHETYRVEIGQVAPKTEYAPRELKNKIATEYKKEQIANALEPQYIIDSSIGEEKKESVKLLFNYVNAVNQEEVKQYDIDPLEILRDRSPIYLYTEQYEMLINLSSHQREELKEQILAVMELLYSGGITTETQAKAINESETILNNTNLAPNQARLAHEIISSLIGPNMIVDTKATDDLIEETINKVEPVTILPGEKIIEQGTRITEETYELLKEAGYIKAEVSSSLKRYIGAAIIILLAAGMFYGYMTKKKSHLQLAAKEKKLIFVIYIIAILTIRLFGGIRFVYMPIAIVPMLIAILIDYDIAIVINLILVIIGGLIYKGDISYFVYFVITGTISALGAINVKKRSKTLAIATYIGALNGLVLIGIHLFVQGTLSMELLVEVAGAFLVGILMLIFVVGSLPFWETAFDIVTPLKLLELTNPDQEILKKLLLEATGTYYHSLLVANLAETAANDIGADPLLARVGGYYHDIGKLQYVNYYKENQIGENPHDKLEPDLSSHIILSHVTYGEELATKYRLPKPVKDIIGQHHGTTLAQYFYIKASNMAKEGEVKKEDYQYKGPKPQTKEAAIVMLADVVEATVRSMMPLKDDGDNLEQVITKIVRNKLEEGQLDESELMIKDLEIIIASFNKLLLGMYHERIAYPTKKEE